MLFRSANEMHKHFVLLVSAFEDGSSSAQNASFGVASTYSKLCTYILAETYLEATLHLSTTIV